MDSVNTDERVESFLSVMLEGYEESLKNIDNFIIQTDEQVNNAKAQKEDVESKIVELKEMLGLSNEPKFEVVKDE